MTAERERGAKERQRRGIDVINGGGEEGGKLTAVRTKSWFLGFSFDFRGLSEFFVCV